MEVSISSVNRGAREKPNACGEWLTAGKTAYSISRSEQMEITYKNKKGEILKPHKFKCGTFVVSKTRFKEDQIHVATIEEVKQYLERGFRVRVSDPVTRSCPSLVKANSLIIQV